MPSTDIDGSPIVILSEDEAKAIYRHFTASIIQVHGLPVIVRNLCNKIAKTFGFIPLPPEIGNE